MSPWTNPKIAELLLKDVELDVRAQMRPDEDYDLEYIETLAAIAPNFRDRIVVFQDGRKYFCGDGFQRHKASQRAKLKTIMADVYKGTLRDAIRYALSANATHGRQRSQRCLQRVFKAIVADKEWGTMTDKEIAELAGVSRPTAQRYLSCLREQDKSATRNVTRTRNGQATTYEMDVSRLTKKQLDAMPEEERVVHRQKIEKAECEHKWVCRRCGLEKIS